MAQLASRAWGEGPGPPRAVLVHGVTSSSRSWWHVGPELAGRGFSVLAVDLRGHGASPRASDTLGLADLAGDVAETLGAGPVDLLVGHSLGALVALELLRGQPGFARRLVLEDPPGPRGVDGGESAGSLEVDVRRAHEAPEELRRDLEAANPSWHPGDAERRIADLLDCDVEQIAAALRGRARDFDLTALVAAVELPTLLVLAAERLGSALVGEDRAAALAALRDGTVAELPVGHSVHREDLAGFLRAIDGWLAATDSPTGTALGA